eukprot:1155969-Pelagomonas_calceolata.AAC.2
MAIFRMAQGLQACPWLCILILENFFMGLLWMAVVKLALGMLGLSVCSSKIALCKASLRLVCSYTLDVEPLGILEWLWSSETVLASQIVIATCWEEWIRFTTLFARSSTTSAVGLWHRENSFELLDDSV